MNRKDIRRASVKCRMVTGTYILQTTQAKFNNTDVDPTCPLCRMEDEDIIHFLLECNALLKYRRQAITELDKLFSGSYQQQWSLIKENPELLTCLILDANTLVIKNFLPDHRVLLDAIEIITRTLCFN